MAVGPAATARLSCANHFVQHCSMTQKLLDSVLGIITFITKKFGVNSESCSANFELAMLGAIVFGVIHKHLE